MHSEKLDPQGECALGEQHGGAPGHAEGQEASLPPAASIPRARYHTSRMDVGSAFSSCLSLQLQSSPLAAEHESRAEREGGRGLGANAGAAAWGCSREQEGMCVSADAQGRQ